MAASAANAPLLLLDDLEMGSATVGGHPSSFANQARAAVAIAKQILDGKAFDRVPVVSTRNSNVFDWPALKRWGFRETTAGSVAADRQSTAWQAYKGYILSAIFLLFLQTVLVVSLFLEQKRRRDMNAELLRSNDRLRRPANCSRPAFRRLRRESGRFASAYP